MPPTKRTTSASSPVDPSTRLVWLLALNCLAACLLPLPEGRFDAPAREAAGVVSAAWTQVADGDLDRPPSVIPLFGPGALANVAAPGPVGRDVVEGPAALAFNATHLFATNERMRAEHFCALYGCLSAPGGE